MILLVLTSFHITSYSQHDSGNKSVWSTHPASINVCIQQTHASLLLSFLLLSLSPELAGLLEYSSPGALTGSHGGQSIFLYFSMSSRSRSRYFSKWLLIFQTSIKATTSFSLLLVGELRPFFISRQILYQSYFQDTAACQFDFSSST